MYAKREIQEMHEKNLWSDANNETRGSYGCFRYQKKAEELLSPMT